MFTSIFVVASCRMCIVIIVMIVVFGISGIIGIVSRLGVGFGIGIRAGIFIVGCVFGSVSGVVFSGFSVVLTVIFGGLLLVFWLTCFISKYACFSTPAHTH